MVAGAIVKDVSSISWDNIHFAHPDHNFYGGLIAVLAAVISNLGVNTQRQSHIRDGLLPPERRENYLSRPLWWLGFGGVIFGALADFVAVGIASQPLVAALGGGTTLVANVFFAKYWNGDTLYPTDGIGVCFIVLGAAAFAVTAERSETYTEAELVAKLSREQFLVYLSSQVIAMCLLLATIATSEVFRWRVHATEKLFSPMLRRMARLEMLRNAHMKRLRERVVGLETALARKQGLGEAEVVRRQARLEKQMRDALPAAEEAELHAHAGHWLDQYIYGACSGIVGAMSLLFAGLTSKMLMRLFRGHYEEYMHPLPYVVIGSLLLALTLQTALLNTAMQRGDTMSIYPVFQAFWITFGVIGGVVYYDYGTVDLSGLAFMIIGTYFLVQHNFYVLKSEAKEEAEEAAAAVLLEGGEGGEGGVGGVAKPKV